MVAPPLSSPATDPTTTRGPILGINANENDSQLPFDLTTKREACNLLQAYDKSVSEVFVDRLI